MCIIASVPSGAQVTEAQLDEMWNRNSDGGGVAYFVDDKIVTEKSMKKKNFIARVLEIQEEYGHRDMLVHMRIATHGSVCLENNHPFQVNKNTVMAHNGIMPDAFIPPAKSDLSDTRFFIEYFMKHIPTSKLDDPYFCDMVDGMINQGYGNKLVFMTSAPTKYDTYIIGEYHGTWDGGVWFSNDSYQQRKWIGINHNSGGLTRVGQTIVSDNCEIVDADDFDMTDESSINDWMTWYPDIWREFQEVGVTNLEELTKAFKVKLSWDGLVCTECSNRVEGMHSRYCEIDCEAIAPVLDWCYENLNMDIEDIDQMLYEESFYKVPRAEKVEQTKLFDNKEGVYKNSKKSKTKKTNKSTKSKKKAKK